MSETNIAIEPGPLDGGVEASVSAFVRPAEPLAAEAGVGAARRRNGRDQRHPPSEPDVALEVCADLDEIEAEWRAFEATAEGTAFQNFGWLSKWQRHIGSVQQVKPAIVLGRDRGGELVFILPLAIEKRGPVRRLR